MLILKRRGLTSAQKKKWVSIANSVLKDCQSKKGKDCEGKAIRIANSKFSEEVIMAKKKIKQIPLGAMRLVATESPAFVELAEGENAKPKMNMTAYSGKIIKGHWYWDDLVIDLQGMVFDKSKYPILENHDRSKKVAFTGKPIITSDFKLKLDEDKTVFVDTAESREFQNLSKDGFPYQSSVYVTPLSIERLDKGVTGEVNGFKLKGPGTIFRKSRFNEASVCVFGWDRETQASAFSTERVDIDLEEERFYLKGDVDSNNRREVNDVPIENLDQLTKEHPDLVTQIQEAVKASMETEFVKERETFKTKLAAKDAELDGQNKRVLKLEKNDTIRSERELNNQADSLWVAKLAESDIPEHLYDKVKNQVRHSKFVKDEILDLEAFGKAIDDEVKDWVDKGVVESSVKGAGFSVERDDANSLVDKKQDEKDVETTNVLLSHVGEKIKKEDT